LAVLNGEFSMSIFEEPASARAERYLHLADSARRYADRTADQALKKAHLEIAQGWEALALEIERKLNESILQARAMPMRPALRSA
jgi:hypothetical protein